MASADYTEEELGIANLVIEKNVPRRPRYPHGAFMAVAKKMQVGDSVLCDSRQLTGLMQALNKLGAKVETRTEGEKRRLWRVE